MSQKLAERPAGSESVRSAEQSITTTNKPDHPIVRVLQRQLANSVVLFINYKHYHWQVAGPLFRDYHLMFDEFAETVEEAMDEFAERIRMIGQDPVYGLTEIQRQATVTPSRVHSGTRSMLEEADRNAILVISEIRDGVEVADQAGDPGTVDLLSKVVRDFEKQEWYFRDLLSVSGDKVLG